MKIGLTYDLRKEYLLQGFSPEEVLEFDSEDTIHAIEAALTMLGYTPIRIGSFPDLVERTCRGETWDMVFNIAEGMRGFAREAQVPSILEAYGIPYTFSDPLSLSLCLHKAYTKRILLSAGIPTTAFHCISSLEDLSEQEITRGYPLFIKPVAEGTGKGISRFSRVESPEQLLEGCAYLLERYRQPVLVEPYLPGREFTVGILGTGTKARSVGVLEIELNRSEEEGIYTALSKEECESLVTYTFLEDEAAYRASEIALETWRIMGCRDGGRVDLRGDGEGNILVLEVNPLAGLHPTHSDLPMIWTAAGREYAGLIGSIVDSALERTEPGRMRKRSA